MADISKDDIGVLLEPYVAFPAEDLLAKLKLYLDLLLRWNRRMNLSAIRDPEEIVRRHFGESLFAAVWMGDAASLLDYGSGAGFPGIPIALLRPEIQVTLAESQGKKAAFLREAVRTLGLSTQVLGIRVEEGIGLEQFDCVTLRSVDGMEDALARTWKLAVKEVIVFTTSARRSELRLGSGFEVASWIQLPESRDRILLRCARLIGVPRETKI